MNPPLFRTWLLAFYLSGHLSTTWAQTEERSWSYTYNALGLIETADGPRTDVEDITRYEYDDQGHLVRVINALGHSTTLSHFDSLGKPQTVTDPNGVITTLSYSAQGWLASASTAGNTTSFEYNAVGDITRLTHGDGSWLAYTWDDARRLTRITNNMDEHIEFDLDPMGNRTAQRLKDSTGKLTRQHQWVYDELGRLLRSVGAAGQTNSMRYDLNDNPALHTNPRNNSNNRAYDPLDRLAQSTNALNGITKYEYDAQDNLTQVKDPREVTTRYQYDALGNLTALISPDSGTSTYVYDTAGNVIKKTDAKGIVSDYEYDALNRLIARRYPSQPELDTQYRYDMTEDGNNGIGRLTAANNADSELLFSYDERGKLTELRQTLMVNGVAQQETLYYRYNDMGQLAQVNYPAPLSLHYQRDVIGRVNNVQIQQVNTPPDDFASHISYLPFGPLTSVNWKNGTLLNRDYDQDYRLVKQTVSNWESTYHYDANGNITRLQSDIFGDLNYQYDALDRLTEEKVDNHQNKYVYDAGDNRIEKAHISPANGQTQDSSVTEYQYETASNRLTHIADQPVTTDIVGNLTEDRADRQMFYDAQNRLSRVKNGELDLAEFRYNALGQRTQKITPQGVTTFLYSPTGQLLGETQFDSQGKKAKTQFYIWLDSLPLGGVTMDYDAQGAVIESTPFYLHSDHLNTPRLATNTSQQRVWQWKSDAFGIGEANGALSLNLRFPGQYFDTETRLHYNYFRDYDPKSGRYMQSDPIGLWGGINTYNYANSNPLHTYDKYGLETTVIHVEGKIPHSALHVSNANGGQFLYDPAGSYVPPSQLPRGSGDFFEGPDANLDSYRNYWGEAGNKVNIYPLGTTEEQDNIIIERAIEQGGGMNFFCAASVSAVLNGVCGVNFSFWPNTLGENASKSNCKASN
ncbi:RHS repeat-associated core domain-containing protein [Pseudomonas batumici]|uniref:RHS repeat-associated core domain-containing protein n=1 Tax=Pseudomonas batumici TaxID=226910 RepID=UPI0030CBC564